MVQSAAAEVLSSLIPELRRAMLGACPLPLPASPERFEGSWGAGLFVLGKPTSGGCDLSGSLSTPLLVRSAPVGGFDAAGAWRQLTGHDWPLRVAWAFAYRQESEGTPHAPACYMGTATGAQSVGYFVVNGTGGTPWLWLPNQYGAQLFRRA